MSLEITEIFMKIDTESGENAAVYRYSNQNGMFCLDVAELKDDIFDDDAREHNWDWIPSRSACSNPDKETYWSSMIVSVSDFDDMFKPETIKSEGATFATFSDFRKSLDKMNNLVESFKADLEASLEDDDDILDTSSFKLPFELAEDLIINDILISDEHKSIRNTDGAIEHFGYVELDVTNKDGRRESAFITTDLFFEKLVFTPSKSVWDFIKADESNVELINRLSEHKDEIQKLVKIAEQLGY